MSEVLIKTEVAATGDGESIIGFSVDALLDAIWTPSPEREKNSSHTATVFGPLEAAKACTYIPD